MVQWIVNLGHLTSADPPSLSQKSKFSKTLAESFAKQPQVTFLITDRNVSGNQIFCEWRQDALILEIGLGISFSPKGSRIALEPFDTSKDLCYFIIFPD